MKASALGVEAAQARVRLATAAYLPKLSFDHTFTRGNNPVYVFGSLLTQRRFTLENFALDRLNVPPPLNNFQNRFSATQSVYDFGRTSIARYTVSSGTPPLRERAGSDSLQFDLSGCEVLPRGTSGAGDGTGGRVGCPERPGCRGRRPRPPEGWRSLESDLLSVQVHRAGQEEELLKASAQLRLAQSALCFELGVATRTPIRPPSAGGPADRRHDGSGGLAGCCTTESARLQAVASSPLKTRSWRSKPPNLSFFPTVSLFGSWETDDQSFASRAGNNWLAGVNLHFNLFNGRADEATLAESRFQQRRTSGNAGTFGSGDPAPGTKGLSGLGNGEPTDCSQPAGGESGRRKRPDYSKSLRSRTCHRDGPAERRRPR